jgi:hypothetical protein
MGVTAAVGFCPAGAADFGDNADRRENKRIEAINKNEKGQMKHGKIS